MSWLKCITPGARPGEMNSFIFGRSDAHGHYDDPLAPIVLSSLAREPLVAAIEADRVDRHVKAATRNLERGQKKQEIPPDLDPELVGAMVLGGIREVLRHALARDPRPPQRSWTSCGGSSSPPCDSTTRGGGPMAKVLYEKRDRIAYVTLNRPEAKNAI